MRATAAYTTSDVREGMRVESGGFYGTVHYKGAIPPTKGEWLGVEWDDPSRGKHDGSHEGTRYFQTNHPTAGSFIRVEKVNCGLPVFAAVKDRYGLIEDGNAGVIDEEMIIAGGKRKVEVVGAQSVNKKQSQFNRLQELVLREMFVCCAGPQGQISGLLPNVTTLDLSKNLIHSWISMAEITKEFPKLEHLNVSENKMVVPDKPEELTTDFQHLKIILLNRMNYDWKQILQCAAIWPHVQELHACFNEVITLGHPGSKLQYLHTLNFESNPLAGWEQVLHVAHLPSLETLLLTDTGIQRIWFPDCSLQEKTNFFKCLKVLIISKNKISQWSSINELEKLQSLEDLRCKQNPLLTVTEKMSEETLRYIVMAKIGHLKKCNKTEISYEERQSCELDYLRIYGKQWRDAGGHQDSKRNKPSQEFTRDHPRYEHLIDKYGAPDDRELMPQSSALKHTLISISMYSPMLSDKPKIKKKLPVSMTVQKLKMILRVLYKVDPMVMKLTYTSHKMADQEIEIESDLKELSFYSIEDGDTIHVRW